MLKTENLSLKKNLKELKNYNELLNDVLKEIRVEMNFHKKVEQNTGRCNENAVNFREEIVKAIK